MRNNTSNSESGYAILFIFAMAAIMGMSLYVALPRITFEAQRDKEELLITRGEQYKRAIQLYVRKFKRFPSKMEDLDNANGLRFLRHHYTDPMTGKEEWRLIHAGPGGVLLDSLVKKQEKDKKEGTQSGISELLGAGGVPEADATANIALRKRPSDQQGAPGSGSLGATPGAPIPPDPPQGTLPGQAPQPTANTPFSNQPPASPAATATTATPPQSGGISAGGGVGSFSAPITNPNPTALPGTVAPQQPGATPQAVSNPATPNAQGSAEAARLIGQLLTTPRPGGLAGLQAGTGNQTIGGGIAGIASTIKTGSGIKIYNQQEEYKKWEFVYDATKEAQTAGGVPQQGQAPGTPVGQPAAGPLTPGQTSPSPVTPPK